MLWLAITWTATLFTAGMIDLAEAATPEPTGDLAGTAPPAVVALDPGHGGTNLGAAGIGRGVYEKKVTLELASRVRELLAQSPGPRLSVILCREADLLVPIRARARCAHESGARVFVSLHANAVPAGVRPGSQRGFEVFVLGPREVEDDATLASLGKTDLHADGKGEGTGKGAGQHERKRNRQTAASDAVWAAHEVRAAAEQSIVLGRAIDGAMTQALGSSKRRGIKQSGAALDVLRGTGTAAALVEVGFLDHPEEGAELATPAGREPIARAIATAIRSYLAAEEQRVATERPPAPAGSAGRPPSP